MKGWRSLWRGCLEIVYPTYCVWCKEQLEDGHVMCDRCFDEAPRVIDSKFGFCEICSESYEGKFEGNPICPNCSGVKFDFDWARSALPLQEKTQRLVTDLKYGKRRYMARVLAKFIDEMLESEEFAPLLEHAILVPVPLHWRRVWERGFDQVDLIIGYLKEQSHLPMVKLLDRHHYTPTQTLLNRKQRLANLSGSFRINQRGMAELEKIAEKNGVIKTIFLIDDVFTTGSTATECASIMRNTLGKGTAKGFANIENVIVVTVLRG